MATLTRPPRPPAPPRHRRNPFGTVMLGVVVVANAVLWMCWPAVVETVAFYL